ncbi:MAG: MG2 domain-containing protein, partial [Gemmataceae bacterium]|nr:MG2 domain-containing protein [Gemmataceae bacterium]
MAGKWKKCVFLALAALVAVGLVWKLSAQAPSHEELRKSAEKAFRDGNFNDAYKGLRQLALDPKCDAMKVGNDLELALQSLQRLGRTDEVDDFREAVIETHQKNWRLLDTAAHTLVRGEHHGFIVAGKFYRGNKRGGTRYVGTAQRDRVRALQLMTQAQDLTKNEQDKVALADFHLRFANLFRQGAGFYEPWRLQYLTDLTKLPDYDEGPHAFHGHGGQAAPVDAEGNPIYHHMPKGYDKAQSDGERWRWHLAQVAEYQAHRLSEVEMIFAGFLQGQFGVQTMAHFGWRFGGDEQNQEKTGTFALHTLGKDETIARLATGIKRFKVPDEFNWIKIYERVADRAKTEQGQRALENLAQIFENRRQYPMAAQVWKRAITEYGPGPNDYRKIRFEQITGNWGRFEPGAVQPAGTKATADFRFRNGTKVSFEAHAVHMTKLLDDVKTYLSQNPAQIGGQLDWNRMQIDNIGHRLVERNEQQYLGEKVAGWDMDLKPRPKNVDERVTVKTPLSKPGVYLVKAQMADGNTSRIIVWVNDTVILKKQLDGKVFYYVADAVSGQPVPKANVEFFGWKQEQVVPNKNQFRVITKVFTEQTNQDGQIILGPNVHPDQFQWLITARKKKAGQEEHDRFAYLGFTGVWFNRIHDPEYNETRTILITDRPVYRPDQTVQFKLWVRHAKYDQADTSSFANTQFTVQINDPKGEKVFQKSYTTDGYGGIAGEFALPKSTTLGMYHLHIVSNGGGGHFRVEEYKKPEFEVKVEAPKEPVRLGDKIEATIQAKYYFGSPVTNAKVKYKVLRYTHTSNWYPRGDWDWFYGSGYWWFAADYPWYPGWLEWCGCRRPFPWWWGGRHEPPEVVLENEMQINPDGTVKVVIDTALAKELHGNQDHRYAITAEVVDQSRRTIVGTGEVLVARKPF